MELSILLIQQIFVMAIMILFGYIAIRCKLLKVEDSSRLALLVLYIISPCLIVDSFQVSFSKEKMIGFVIALIASAGMHVIFIILAKICARWFHFLPVEEASVIYSNCGNLLVPLIGSILGSEYVLYCCAFITIQNILFWTQGYSLINESPSYNIKKILLNPNMIATFLGLIMFFSKIKLPPLLGSALEKTGACIGPISMIVIGILIASSDLKKSFARSKNWIVCICRLLIAPLMVLVALRFSNLSHVTPDAGKVLLVSFLASAAPVAVNVTQVADVCGQDSVLSGSINVMSITLCIITLPIMTYLYQMTCM